MKENATCTITCDTVYQASEDILPQIDTVKEAAVGSDQDSWPNLLIVVDESTRCKQVVFLNDTANRAYVGKPRNVVGLSDLEAAKEYMSLAVDSGYLREQFDYTGKYDVPSKIFDKLVCFRSEYEAISEGLIPIPREFYSSPSLAFIVDDSGMVKEVIFLNSSANTEYANINTAASIGKDPMDAVQEYLHVLYARGYINNYDIPYSMFDHLLKIYNEGEAIEAGIK